MKGLRLHLSTVALLQTLTRSSKPWYAYSCPPPDYDPFGDEACPEFKREETCRYDDECEPKLCCFNGCENVCRDSIRPPPSKWLPCHSIWFSIHLAVSQSILTVYLSVCSVFLNLCFNVCPSQFYLLVCLHVFIRFSVSPLQSYSVCLSHCLFNWRIRDQSLVMAGSGLKRTYFPLSKINLWFNLDLRCFQ